jgi:hypothetical protein
MLCRSHAEETALAQTACLGLNLSSQGLEYNAIRCFQAQELKKREGREERNDKKNVKLSL